MQERSGALFVAAVAVVSSSLTGPAAAQMRPGMLSTEQTSGGVPTERMSAAKPMSQADMAEVKACNAMAAEARMKDATCVALMHANPDMVKHPDPMAPGGDAGGP